MLFPKLTNCESTIVMTIIGEDMTTIIGIDLDLEKEVEVETFMDDLDLMTTTIVEEVVEVIVVDIEVAGEEVIHPQEEGEGEGEVMIEVTMIGPPLHMMTGGRPGGDNDKLLVLIEFGLFIKDSLS